MNSRNIKPISFWSPNGEKQATVLQLYNFHGYNFDGSPSSVSYRLGYMEIQSDSDESFVCLSEGSVPVPDEVVQNWGQDDGPIFDHVVELLNLERV